MIRLIVFAVIGLVIGLGGGSGVVVMRAMQTALAVRDRASAKEAAFDSEKEGAEKKTHAPEGGANAANPTPRDSEPVVHVAVAAADSASVVKPAPTPAVAHAPVTRPAPDTGRGAQPAVPGRISKIFAAMSPKDASRVLEQLEDSDVQTVLVGLNDKQAAAILSGFPPARAAAISRAALRNRKLGP